MVWGLEEAAKRKWDKEGRAKPKLWGYFAVDAEDSRGAIGGPARAALQHGYDRLLAYTPYGKRVLGKSLEGRGAEIGWLPHGIDLEVFQPQCDAPEQFQESWAESGWPVIGCVATNTPRKDLGTLFAALEGVECHLWLHTDRATTSAWSVQELARQFGRSDPRLLHVSGVEGPSEDSDLARWYSVCAATYAPGLGEGFCYPGVEALACGTPVVGLDYAGLPEFIPEPRWRVKPAAWRLEGAYAIKRPVADVAEVRKALLAAAEWKQRDTLAAIEYCRISVAHLGWEELWPWWEKWIREGLKEVSA
jgi:glycosyltransferase involved in cell wall biosynthesis